MVIVFRSVVKTPRRRAFYESPKLLNFPDTSLKTNACFLRFGYLRMMSEKTIFAFAMDKNLPTITVVIPVYNREKLVGRTLASVSAQTARDFCVILVDNGSTDNSLDVLKQWASKQTFEVRILTEPRRGAASARQAGLEAVRTPWCMFFDSDDVMLPTHIARALSGIDENPDADVIGWNICFRAADGRENIQPFVTRDMQFRSLFNGTTGTLRYCARTSLFHVAGGWSREVGVWDDIELGARLIAQEPKVVKLDGAPTVAVYIGQDSMSCGEQASNIEVLDRALVRIGKTLGPSKTHWIELKRVLVAAKSPKADGDALMRRILVRNDSCQWLYRFAYAYTRCGGRGIARILRPLL